MLSIQNPGFMLYWQHTEIQMSHISGSQFSSVAQSCPTFCDPMNCSTPGLPVQTTPGVHPNSCPFSR